MIHDNLVLLLIFSLGLAFGNRLVAGAAGAVLVLRLSNLPSILGLLDRRAMDAGLFFLLVAVLTPFAVGRAGPREILAAFRDLPGIVAIAGGTVAAYICGQGVSLLQMRPEITVGLLVGTILGVALLRGVPVGPLAAAGLTAVLLNLLGLGKK